VRRGDVMPATSETYRAAFYKAAVTKEKNREEKLILLPGLKLGF